MFSRFKRDKNLNGDSMTDDSNAPTEPGAEFDADSAPSTATQEGLTTDVAWLQGQVEGLSAELEATRGDFLRARADFSNLKRRTEEERESLRSYLIEETIQKLLPILDNFERALVAASQTSDYEKLVVGVNAIYKQFGEVVVGEGVLVIPGTPGTPFDPNLHNAVLRDEESGYPENTIVEELQRGYMLGSKVLRPTLVKVATGG
ncbi:nucleotide exchange factor GrpE [Armatimonas sp.]|uniref:nucleotide exchange factor GrpE n=1 Tax=Armatimonas sp. TaxID=1872638 RepID=UPI00375185C9